jgi:Xaa-Pro dipeptidase
MTPAPGQQRRGGVFTQVWDGYSVAERDRRWSAVRAEAARAGLDCIFVPIGNGIDARYLTQFRASSVVIPTDGRPPVAITDRGARNTWFPEPRLTSRAWAEPMAEVLLEAGMEHAHIGVAGLRGGRFSHVSAPEGVVNHSPFEYVRARLPNATFQDATDVVGRARYIKSEEEIACLRRAASIALGGAEELGAGDASRVMGRLLRMGSEYFPLSLQPRPGGFMAEINAVWGTQIAQVVETVGAFSDASAREREAFDAGLIALRPGTTWGDVLDAVPGEAFLQGLGAGDDGPLLGESSSRDFVFETNTVFVWKPRVQGVVIGRPIVITERGAEAAA